MSLIQVTSNIANPNTNYQKMPHMLGGSHNQNTGNLRGPRPLDQVTCYKVKRILLINYISLCVCVCVTASVLFAVFQCGEKGHYANKCTKGHLAFLSGQ